MTRARRFCEECWPVKWLKYGTGVRSVNYPTTYREWKLNLTFRHRNFTFNSNKLSTWCNNFSVYYSDVCLQLNMFRAFSRSLSGAQRLQWQPLVLSSYRGNSRTVFVVEPAGPTLHSTAVQRAFRLRFNIQPPTRKSICRWNHQFEQIGCLCKGKSSDRPRVSEENLRRGCIVAILLSTDAAARLCARGAL
jgi:hypothetical protein